MKILSNIIIGIVFVSIWVWVFIGTQGFDASAGKDALCFGIISLILSIPSALVLILYNNRD